MSEPVIEAQGLTRRFGPVEALRGIDFSVEAGRVLAILGPNGAGKSTLLRLLAGLARPTSGRLRVGRADGDRRGARAQVGYLGHATLLYPNLTARENLVFAARLHGLADAEQRATTWLERSGLGAVADRLAGGFSRGMAQRLAIARGLVHDPAVVLLDEPFTGLDRGAAETLAQRVRGLRDEGRTLLLVTHEIARAASLADAVLMLARGRIVFRADGEAIGAEALDAGWQRCVEGAA